MVMQLELVSHRPPFPQLAEQAPPHEIASRSPSTETAAETAAGRNSRWDSRRNSRRCSFSRAQTKPKAGTGTNCNLNAQEQDKQHIELQKQHPQMAEQAPPHEIASAALNRKNSRSNSRCCSYPTARTKPKAGTGTNCNLNAQEQDKQHIELQKQHPDLPEQATSTWICTSSPSTETPTGGSTEPGGTNNV